MEYQNNHAKIMKLKILSILPVPTFKNVKTVPHPKERSLEILEIAGQHLVIQFGKYPNMAW
jgi:hypothetical protein